MTFRLKSLLLFFAVAAMILFWNLHRVPLFDPDEGRYSDIGWEMLKTGDLMIPRMNFVVHLHKPPLSNWFVALGLKTFGANEFGARFPSVILSLILLGFVVNTGRFLFDFRSGLYSAWILLTSVLYFAISRLVTTDMTLVFWTALSVMFQARLFFDSKHPRLYFYACILTLSFAMLTKGPVGWMIGILPGLFFAIWRKKKINVRTSDWVIGIFLLLVLSLSWYFVIVLRYSGGLHYFLNFQLAQRMGAGKVGRAHPLFYYFLVMPLGFMPWFIFMPSVIRWWQKAKSISETEREKYFFLLFWFLIPFILFCLFRTKLATYIVPLYPPLALIAGKFWKEIDEGSLAMTRPMKVSAGILSFSYFGLLIGGHIFIHHFPHFVRGIGSHFIWIASIYLFAGSTVAIAIFVKKCFRCFFRYQVGFMVGLGLLVMTALPQIQFKNSKAFVQKIEELRKPGEKVLMYNTYIASLPFYLQERVIEVFTGTELVFETPEQTQGYVYTREEDIRPFLEGSDRVFVLGSNAGWEKAKRQTPTPLFELLRRGKFVLFSNKA